MQTIDQQRAQGTGRFISSTRLLGGAAPVSIPAGTTVRMPLALPTLDFAGFNSLSVFATIADFAAGDALKVRVNTLDPESAAADPVGGAGGVIAAKDLITVTANGDFAGTLHLPTYYASLGNTFMRPTVDLGGGLWRDSDGNVSLFDYINETVEDDVRFITQRAGNGATICSMRIGPTPSPVPSPSALHRVYIAVRHNAGTNANQTFNWDLQVGGAKVIHSSTGNVVATDGVFHLITYDLTAAEIFNVPFGIDGDYTDLRMFFHGSGAVDGFSTGWFDVSWNQFQIAGGGGGGVGTGMLPFYLNFFEWVNTGATAVTVSKFEAELTNAW